MNIGIAMSMHMHIIMLVCFFMRISNPFTYSQSSFLPVTIALCMVKVNGYGRKKALLCKLTKFGKWVWIILSVSMVRLRDLPDGAAAQHGIPFIKHHRLSRCQGTLRLVCNGIIIKKPWSLWQI